VVVLLVNPELLSLSTLISPLSCECAEGTVGEFCEVPTEVFCVGQCSGRGECLTGFCKCDAGWYGTDCGRRASGGIEVEADGDSRFKVGADGQIRQG